MAQPDQTAFSWQESAAARERDQREPTPARREALSPREPAPELPGDGELWDIEHAARFLKMSTSWVYKRVEAGTLPCVRVGGWSLRFVPADLRAWATQQPTKRRVRRAATTGR